MSTFLELAGFAMVVAGAFLLGGLGLALLVAGFVVMVVGYAVGSE